MFRVPDWGEDVPKSSLDLTKNTNKPRKRNKNVKPASPKKIHKTNSPVVKEIIKANKVKSPAKKRKHNGQIINNKRKKNDGDKIDVSTIDTDKLDEEILNAKKKKFYEPMRKDDVEHLLFKEETNAVKKSPIKLSRTGKLANIIDKHHKINKHKFKKTRQVPEQDNKTKKIFQINNDVENLRQNGIQQVNTKKEKLKGMLQAHGPNSNRNSITVTGNRLRERMLERLKAAQFRYLNERLYTSTGTEAKEMFQSDPIAFQTYHQGYQQQLKKWPVNPLELIIKRILRMPKTNIVADMGCGEAALSKRVPHSVRSFDLVSTAPGVEICDMARTPLLSASVDVAVYCLALMGTDLTQYLLEANRVLKMGGHLLIAEVESRFDDVDSFTKEVSRLGFKLKNLDKKNQVFFFMEFSKISEPPVKKSRLPVLTLKPCLYKRR